MLPYCYLRYIFFCNLALNFSQKNIKMSVTLRRRKNKDGTTSLVLDIYYNGQRQLEFLKDLKLLKITSPIDREENRERIRLAEQIKNKREQELQSNQSGVIPAYKKSIDFIQFYNYYVESYTKKNKRVIIATFNRFKQFLFESGIQALNTNQVTENLVIDFKDYLEKNLTGETPSGYFAKFKLILKYGVKQKVFLYNPGEGISIKRVEGIKKEILTFEEIQQLADVNINNDQVKRAFLFSCNTGLRFCDVRNLKWANINNGILKITQLKTMKPVNIALNESAHQLLGESLKPNDLVFNLPSHTACLKSLRVWCRKAGIHKKITWHCARHSFGTGLIYYGGDVSSVSSLLGHSSYDYTMRYVRISDQLKDKSINNLPKIIIK